MRKIRFIYNPKAGRKKSNFSINTFLPHFPRNRYYIDFFTVTKVEQAREFAKDAVNKRFDAIVAIGGDGTVFDILQSIRYSSTALAIIPTGNTNSLASALKLDVKLEKSINIIKGFTQTKVDLFSVKSNQFYERFGVSSIGLGIGAEAIHRASKVKGRKSYGTFLKSMLNSVFSYKMVEAEVEFNYYNQRDHFFELTVCNLNQWGKKFRVIPNALPNDGILDLFFSNKKLKLATIFVLLFRLIHLNRVLKGGVEYRRTDHLAIKLNREQKIQIDGEPFMLSGEINVSVLKSALNVIVSKATQTNMAKQLRFALTT